MTAPIVYAAHPWKTNAELIAHGCVPLRYLRADWPTLDPTCGTKGKGWWKLWQPDDLERHDIETTGVDFRAMPPGWKRRFKVVAYDPPYKMNGRPTAIVDDRYGVGTYRTAQQRRDLMLDGFIGCWDALDYGGYLLAKCQDQVCGGKVHWQTDWYTDTARALGMRKVDRLDIVGRSRPQPARTRKDGKPSVQMHARRNGSALMVFEKPRPPHRGKVAA